MKLKIILLISALLGAGLVQADTLELNFSFGSEKKGWLSESIETFNQQHVTTPDGKSVIHVNAFIKGSGDAVLEILNAADGDPKAKQIHMTSQASQVFLDLANDKHKGLLNNPTFIAQSPVVIAMWEPMANALAKKLGKPANALAWSDILQLAKDKSGWGAFDHPEWGQFKFGHTTPAKSNSGISAVAAMYYAGVRSVNGGKSVANLNLSQVNDPRVRQFVKDIENSVIHYGESTGFFADNMVDGGMDYLSAAVLYENVVIEKNSKIELSNRTRPRGTPEQPKLIAIYPTEGTFITDHPVSVVNLPYVTPVHQAAIKKFVDFLKSKSQQESAMNHGFRPSTDEISDLGPQFSPENGVDASVDLSGGLAMPSLEVVSAILEGWKYVKKSDDLAIVFDRSGSMQGIKIETAKNGAFQIVEHLGASDRFTFLDFDDRLEYVTDGVSMTPENKRTTETAISAVQARAGTAMRDAVADAYDRMCNRAQDDALKGQKRIHAIFIMTDGDDTDSRLSQREFVSRLKSSTPSQPAAPPPARKPPGFFSSWFGTSSDDAPQVIEIDPDETLFGRFSGGCPERITIFAIAYESEGNVLRRLQEIAIATHGKAVEGSRGNIEKLWNDLGDFL